MFTFFLFLTFIFDFFFCYSTSCVVVMGCISQAVWAVQLSS